MVIDPSQIARQQKHILRVCKEKLSRFFMVVLYKPICCRLENSLLASQAEQNPQAGAASKKHSTQCHVASARFFKKDSK